MTTRGPSLILMADHLEVNAVRSPPAPAPGVLLSLVSGVAIARLAMDTTSVRSLIEQCQAALAESAGLEVAGPGDVKPAAEAAQHDGLRR